VGGVFEIPFRMARQCIDDIVVVSEAAIKKATAELLLGEKIVAEPSSATCVAALWTRPDLFAGEKVALVISGGNLDKELMRQLIM
jgi:threonine dehydratase